jgi:hypothetical protein
MQRWAARCGWDALADTLGREACTLEQEAVQARLPD